MDNSVKNDLNMEIDSDSNTTVKGEKSLLDVLRTEPDIIADVFSHLKLADRLNLGVSCKQMEKVHSSRPQFWQKVVLDLGKAVASSSNPDLTRKYVNIKYHIGELQAKQSPGEKLGPIAGSIKEMKIDYDGSYATKKIENSSEHFVGMLPLYEKLEHLELFLGGAVLRKLDRYLKTESSPATAVSMTNLRRLTINLELFAILHGRVDFSSIARLKLLVIFDTSVGILVDVLQSSRSKVMDLIMQQKGLEKLELSFSGCSSIFDHPFVLGYKLKEFDIFDYDNQNSFTRQDNLLDFLEAQKPELTSPKFLLRLSGQSRTPRMTQYCANIFDLPLECQSFVVRTDSEVRRLSDAKMEFSVSEIRQLRVEPNLVTTSVKVNANISQHHNVWLDFICLKFPNMTHLNVGYCTWTDNSENENPLSLIPLQTLSHLKCLKIETNDICNALRDVTLPHLNEFECVKLVWLEDHYDDETDEDDGFVNLESLRELKMFINRHTKLTHLSLKLPNNDYSKNIDVNYEKEANDLLHYAIKNLKELMSMEFSSIEYLRDPSNLEKTRNMIETHANIGFTLKDDFVCDGDYSCIELTLTKTADGVEERKKR